MIHGILNINKPSGITSAGVVGRVKRLLPRKTKVGHAGTLDPFATGVLVILIGRATKLCESLMGSPKQYIATIRFGATTDTDDRDSPERVWEGSTAPDRERLESALRAQTGTIYQRPPVISALKIGGMRACDRVRAGESVAIAPRPVQIYSIDLLDYAWPEARIRVDCGRGTYIRAIARDVGEALNVGGYLSQLQRTRVGEHDLSASIKLDDLTPERLAELIRPLQ